MNDGNYYAVNNYRAVSRSPDDAAVMYTLVKDEERRGRGASREEKGRKRQERR